MQRYLNEYLALSRSSSSASLCVPPPPLATRSISEPISSISYPSGASSNPAQTSSIRRRPLPQPPGGAASSPTTSNNRPAQTIGTVTTTPITPDAHVRTSSISSIGSPSTPAERVSIAGPTQTSYAPEPVAATIPLTANAQYFNSSPALGRGPSRSASTSRGKTTV